MRPEWRRLLPLPAAFLAGMLASLLLGPGPRSIVAGDGGQAPWALPADQARDLAAADEVWAQRHPWGRSSMSVEEAEAQAVAAAVPVGVVETRGGLQALFSLDGALPVAVDDGATTPDGGTVTSIAKTVITWQDAEGEPRRRELFQEARADAPPADDPAAAAPQPPSLRTRS